MSMYQNVAPGVCWSSIPPRESDAGPDTRRKQQHSWRYHVDDLLEEVRDLDRLRRDDVQIEKKLAREYLTRIHDWADEIEKALGEAL